MKGAWKFKLTIAFPVLFDFSEHPVCLSLLLERMAIKKAHRKTCGPFLIYCFSKRGADKVDASTTARYAGEIKA